MPDIFGALVRDWDHIEHAVAARLPHHPASAETPAATATIGTSTQEEPVSLLAEIKTDLANLAAKAEHIDEEAVTKLEAVTAHPEALDAFNTLAHLAGLPLPSGVISGITAGLKAVAAMMAPVAAPQPVPAGPVVAGQA